MHSYNVELILFKYEPDNNGIADLANFKGSKVLHMLVLPAGV